MTRASRTLWAFCSSGVAPSRAAAAAREKSSGEGAAPTRIFSAAGARRGTGDTEPSTTRASRIDPPATVNATQASTSGQSKDSFSLSFL